MQRAKSLSAAATNDAASFRVPARYRYQKNLGSGSYGVVAAFHDQDRGRDVAIKRVRKVFDNFLVCRRTLREIRLMSHFRHPNLMRLHKVLPLESGGDLYMSIELMDCDLDTLLHTKRQILTEKQVRSFTAQMFLGLMAMHAGHVIHRDLKPANIFVRLDRGQVKIGDLGLSRGIAVDEASGEASHPAGELLTEYVVTRWYRAPEVLLCRSKYGPPVDVWSVGSIVYEMCSRKALFPGKNSYDQLKRIVAALGGPAEADTTWVPRESMPLLQKCYPSGASSQRGGLQALCSSLLSSDGIDLLQQSCLFNPDKRISVEQALLHPFLAGLTSEQDRRSAKSIEPADVTYDKIFDGVGKAGEPNAIEQLSRLLRREVSKWNPTRQDPTPEASQAERSHVSEAQSRSAKSQTTGHNRTPRSGPQAVAEAMLAAQGGSARNKATSDQQQTMTSSERSSSTQQLPHHEVLAAYQQRRRASEPDADYWARRTGTGNSLLSRDGTPPRRRSADDGRPTTSDSMRNLQSQESRSLLHSEDRTPVSLPAAPPASGPAPSAFWMTAEDKSPASKAVTTSRHSAREYAVAAGPKRRIAGCSGGSAATVSTRATPQGSRPGTEASTRASSRVTSTSRPRQPSLSAQWVTEPEGILNGTTGPADAAAASPRASPPVVSRSEEEAHHGVRRHHCWLGPEASASQQADHHHYSQASGMHGSRSQRSLREAAADSNQPVMAPDVGRPSRHESLASLDEVLREMKELLKKAPEGNDPLRDEPKLQERQRTAATASRTSSHAKLSGRSSSRPSTGLRSHRVTTARAAEAEDRSPSSHRVTQRRQALARNSENRASSRQRSHDELDFAVSEAIKASQALQDGGAHHTPRRSRHTSHGEAPSAPTPPWTEQRKPLETLDVDHNSPDRGPTMPWARGGSARNLHEPEQDWKQIQSNWNASKVHGSLGHHQRQLVRSSSMVKRASHAASENLATNPSLSALGFIF